MRLDEAPEGVLIAAAGRYEQFPLRHVNDAQAAVHQVVVGGAADDCRQLPADLLERSLQAWSSVALAPRRSRFSSSIFSAWMRRMSRRTSSPAVGIFSPPGRPLRPAGRAAIPASAAGTSCGRPGAASLPAPERSGRWSRRGGLRRRAEVTHLLEHHQLAGREAAEHRHHDERGARDDPRGRADPEGDRAVVAGQVVALADPAEQEDVVVHREPEEDGEEEEWDPGLDRIPPARTEETRADPLLEDEHEQPEGSSNGEEGSSRSTSRERPPSERKATARSRNERPSTKAITIGRYWSVMPKKSTFSAASPPASTSAGTPAKACGM